MSAHLDVDPASLTLGPNVRIDTKLDAGFVASIRERGVLEPIVCYPGPDGLVVQFGQRRSLAALQAGRESVPVFVVDAPSDVDRLTDQIIENDQRAELSTAERVKGWEQLAAFGLSASVIAKRTGAKKAQVETGLKAMTPTTESPSTRPAGTRAAGTAAAKVTGS